ncbi:MAG TPA: hypothetical protein VER03_15065 [Bryobacteraceae bacterium]|nr:hypothetical protein [Bryobacteraceae bacterium]
MSKIPKAPGLKAGGDVSPYQPMRSIVVSSRLDTAGYRADSPCGTGGQRSAASVLGGAFSRERRFAKGNASSLGGALCGNTFIAPDVLRGQVKPETEWQSKILGQVRPGGGHVIRVLSKQPVLIGDN